MVELLAKRPDGSMTLTKEGAKVADRALMKSFKFAGDILTSSELDELATLRARVGELEAQLAEGVRHVRALIDPYALRSRRATIERAEAWADKLRADPALTSAKGG